MAVSVTNAHVKVRYLDEWPKGVTDTNVTALCAIAETRINSKVGASGTFPLTSDDGIQLSVDVVVQMIEYAKWAQAGMAVQGIQPPPLFTREMLERIETILMDTTLDGIDLIDTNEDIIT